MARSMMGPLDLLWRQAVEPDQELIDLGTTNPLWTWNPTFKHIYVLLFETDYPTWLWNTMSVAIGSTRPMSVSRIGPMPENPRIERLICLVPCERK